MIDLQHIERSYNVGGQPVHALQDVNLHIDRGEYLSVMGPSGSGKSTLLNIIGLLDRPDAGRYLLDDKDVTALSDDQLARVRREKIGFVFQFFHLVPRLSAADNIALPMILGGVAPEERQPRITKALASLGLADRAQHRPDELSGGQRQRVAIARAMIMHPQVILADEPTGNLDRASGEEVIRILEQLNGDGITLLIVTHDPEIGRRARRRLHMIDGRVTADVQGAVDHARQ